MAVHGAGDELLAGTALAVDEHGALARAEAADHREHVADLRARADDLRHAVAPRDHRAQGDVLSAEQLLLDGLRDDLEQLDVLPRLPDEVVGAEPHRLHRGIDVGVAGEHDELGVDLGAARPAQDVEARVIRKLNVREDDVELVASEHRHRLAARRRFHHGHLIAGEHAREEAADVGVVVDDERANAVLHVAPMIALG